MNNSPSSSVAMEADPSRHEQPDVRARLALRLLQSLRVGELELVFPDRSSQHIRGDATATATHRAQLELHDFRALSMAVSRGDIGFGESYMQGLWSSPNLTALLRLLIANREALTVAVYGQWWATLVDQVLHLLRSNRRSQARKNIAAHYDLGNSFYSIWLDPTMTYSSAVFDRTGCWGQDVDLQAGQERTMDRAIDQLGIDPHDDRARVLEIGCGWGGLADRLLTRTACRYKGLTLSAEQKAWAENGLKAHPVGRAHIALQDYRDEVEQFDAIVSIEMFEAVGERYWQTYFKALQDCLRPGGRALIQTIVIRDALFKRYRRGTDFIQRYIFPGGMLPSPSAFEELAKGHGLEIADRFGFGQDYARTLSEWLKRFDAHRNDVEALGFDAPFQRMWRFYLAYCEAGFAEGDIDVIQYTLIKS